MPGQAAAVRGVAKRVQGRRASRFEALVTAAGAAVALYRFLRSGIDGESSTDDESPSEG